MAPFERDQIDRIDWPLFQNGPVTMYWQVTVLDRELERLRQVGYRVLSCSCHPWGTTADALCSLADVLQIPGFEGANLNALSDSLTDLPIPVDAGVVLALRGYDKFVAADPEVAYALLDILADASRFMMLFGERFAILVQSDDPALSIERVGAVGVHWNRREWANSSRGVQP